MAESPGNADDDRSADASSSGRSLRSGPAERPAVRRGLLATAGVLAAVSALAAVSTGRSASGTSGAELQDAAAAGAASSSAGSFTVAPAGAVILPAAPAHVADPAPADPTAITGLAANGIPNVALNAYRVAADRIDAALPSCGIDWSLLAGIGRVESNHGRFAGAVLNPDGTSSPKIVGPALDGVQFAFIADTDNGRWDGDGIHDRAVGPMQFIPSTWRSYAIDADGNGTTDPLDIDDAALAAAHYLCVAGGDLRTDAGKRRAVLAYNHSDSYVDQVLALAAAYAAGIPVADLPLVGDTTGPVPAPSGNYTGPAAPGPALGVGDATPSPEGQATALPAGPAPAADTGTATPPADPRPATPTGTASGAGAGGGTGAAAGSAAEPAAAPPAEAAPAPPPAPVAPGPPVPVPLPVPAPTSSELPTLDPAPIRCLPGTSLPAGCTPA